MRYLNLLPFFSVSYFTITFLEKTITKYFLIKSISIDKGLPL